MQLHISTKRDQARLASGSITWYSGENYLYGCYIPSSRTVAPAKFGNLAGRQDNPLVSRIPTWNILDLNLVIGYLACVFPTDISNVGMCRCCSELWKC